MIAALLLAGIAGKSASAQFTTPDPSKSPFAEKQGISKGSLPIVWGQLPFNDFGEKPLVLSSEGLRRIRPVPAPGVHPRIYFGPDDLPEIRERLERSRAGKTMWLNALAWIHTLKGDYNPNAPYGSPHWSNSKARVPIFRIGGNNQHGEIYKALVAGRTDVDPGYTVNVFPLEAFRCLIENDTKAARDLAKALITIIQIDQNLRAKAAKPVDREHPYGPGAQIHAGPNIALTYDLLYNFLTPEERDTVRHEIAISTDYYAHYGSDTSAPDSTSNWCTLDSFYVTELLSIEGEPGFNDLKFRGQVRAWRNFLTYGWYPSGEAYEGRGKNYQYDDTLVAFAMRGVPLDELPSVHAYGNNLLFHNIQPYRNSFFAHDLWGGTDRGGENFTVTPAQGGWYPQQEDIVGLKYLFPDDKRIDWVYRNAVSEDYSRLPTRPDGYNNPMIPALVFALDYDPTNNDPAKIANGNTFFSPERGLLITRSGWGTDDLMLSMHTRQDLGGHTSADRNGIILSGKGRIWARLDNHNESMFTNSVVTIDHQQQSPKIPAHVVAESDAPLATFMAGDSKYAWDWIWSTANGSWATEDADKVVIPAGYTKVMETPNDFNFLKLDYKYANTPFFYKPSWLFNHHITAYIKKPFYPVKKSFRTAGIVRGAHPFALVVDDIQKSDAPAHYDWLFQIPEDVAIAHADTQDVILIGGNDPKSGSKADHSAKKGEPELLVRLLRCHRTGAAPATAGYLDYNIFYANELKTEKPMAKKTNTVRTLVLPADAVSPEYVVLLFPFRAGEELPKTTLSANEKTLRVEWKDQVDTLHLTMGSDGRTRILAEDRQYRATIE
jgi:hypothetical protein